MAICCQEVFYRIWFYLLNMGLALIIMEIRAQVTNSQGILEVLSSKIGGFSIYLGVMLFLNMYLFFRGRRISRLKQSSSLHSSADV
jgi:hypothetical protein